MRHSNHDEIPDTMSKPETLLKKCGGALNTLGVDGYASPIITRDDLVSAFKGVRDQDVGLAVKSEFSKLLEKLQ